MATRKTAKKPVTFQKRRAARPPKRERVTLDALAELPAVMEITGQLRTAMTELQEITDYARDELWPFIIACDDAIKQRVYGIHPRREAMTAAGAGALVRSDEARRMLGKCRSYVANKGLVDSIVDPRSQLCGYPPAIMGKFDRVKKQHGIEPKGREPPEVIAEPPLGGFTPHEGVAEHRAEVSALRALAVQQARSLGIYDFEEQQAYVNSIFGAGQLQTLRELHVHRGMQEGDPDYISPDDNP